jgi:NADPH2:quinone reductase
MKFKKIVITHKGGPENLKVVEEELSEPASGEVRVKVLTAGVGLADIMWQYGKIPGSPKPPFTPGYDLVGVVDKLGSDISKFNEGQMVAALVVYGGYTQYTNLSAEKLVPVPQGLDPAEVVCLTLNYVTGYQIFKRLAKVSQGNRVLIHGAAGGVGSAMLQLGKVMDLEMYGTASKSKHDLVSNLGATPIDYRHEDFVKRIFELTGDGVDLVVDPIGGPHLKRSFKTLRSGGFLAVTSSMAALKGDISSGQMLWSLIRLPIWNILPNKKSAKLFVVDSYNKKNPKLYEKDLKVLMGYLADGKIKPVIAKRMPLVEASKAQKLIWEAKVKGKIVLICNE